MNKFFRIANVSLKVEGDKEILKYIEKDLSYVKYFGHIDNVDLEIKITNDSKFVQYNPQYYSLSGKISFNRNSYMKKEKGYSYIVDNLFDFSKNTQLTIIYTNKQSLISRIKNIIRSYRLGITKNHSILKNNVMSYSLFWYMFHIVLLKKNSAFIHAGVIDKSGDGIILAGTGGCGKTSTTFKLLELKDYKYLSEDFGIIDSDGQTFYNPKFTSIYNSDVKHGQTDLVSYIEQGMTKKDKVLWKSFNGLGGNSMRKIAPLSLLGKERLKKETKIKYIYFFARSSKEEIVVKDVSIEELIERCLNASFRELGALYEILHNIHSVGYNDNHFPLLEDLKNRTREVYRGAFENSIKKVIYIPLNSSPQEIIEHLEFK